MKKRTFTSRTAAGLALTIGAFLVGAPAAEAAPKLFGITAKGELAKFRANKPQKVNTKDLDGIPNGVKLVGIDEQPSSGRLFGIGDDSTVYRIARNGNVRAIGSFDDPQISPLSPGVALDGRSFAVDFNPVPDAIRIVSNTGQNLRVSPTTGDLVAEDGDINGANAQIVDGAYTNSRQTAMAPATATLYVLDAREDRIYTQNPPNDGTLVQPVNLDFDLTRKTGFDLLGNGVKGYVANTKGKSTKLYRVKGEFKSGLSGDTKNIGKVGAKLTALAVDQREPS